MALQSQVIDILPPPGLENVVPRIAQTLELSKYLPDDMPGQVYPMMSDDLILAHANLELIRQNAELRAQIARMRENTIPAKSDSRIVKRSTRVVERISKNGGWEQLLRLKPAETDVAVPEDSPSPTASTVCSSGCTSEVDESPKSNSRELSTDEYKRSQDEVSQESPARHRVQCASEICESRGTTIIMRNIPFEYTRDTVLELIDRQGFNGLYDLVCMPVDFQTELNHGYVFINFVTLEDAAGFKKHFQGFSNWNMPGDSVCDVAWFDGVYNIDSHIQRYRDSPLMHESVEDRFKPVLFKNGVRTPFPEPTKKIRPPRRKKNGEQKAN